MNWEFDIELYEDTIEKDDLGRIIHHLLNTLHGGGDKNRTSYGHLTYAGHDLAASNILDDVRVYYVHFRGPMGGPYNQSIDDRELWAHPLRIDILSRLAQGDYHWYLSFGGEINIGADSIEPVSINQELLAGFIRENQLDSLIVKSELPWGYGKGYRPKLFFEVPNDLLSEVVNRYWCYPRMGYDIEGYLLPSRSMNFLHEWDKLERDDKLFREVIDVSFIAFYCFPGEPRDFVFITNKISFEEFRKILDVRSLERRAEDIGESIRKHNHQ